MTSKTLTDPDDDLLRIDSRGAGCVFLASRRNDKWTGVGPFDSASLIAAIREVAGETDEPATPTAEDFAKAEFARHPDGRIAVRTSHDFLTWCVSQKGTWHWFSDTKMSEEGWQIVTPSPRTPREALALAVSLAYEPEGDTMPDQPGYMMVGKNGRISVLPAGNPYGIPVRDTTYRRLLLDPPAPVTPAWHDARIVEATCRGRACQWARTRTDGLWVSLDGESREAYTPDLSDVTVIVPGEVEA